MIDYCWMLRIQNKKKELHYRIVLVSVSVTNKKVCRASPIKDKGFGRSSFGSHTYIKNKGPQTQHIFTLLTPITAWLISSPLLLLLEVDLKCNFCSQAMRFHAPKAKSLKKNRRTSAMFKSISLLRTPFRALPQTLFSFSTHPLPPIPNHLSFFRNPINPISPTLTSLSSSILFSPFSHSSRQKKLDEDDSSGDDDRFVVYKDPKSPPRLFVVQPRLRPETLMQAKLSEALNLANSLEEQRDSDDFGSEETPPHLVVQNPAARSPKAHAGCYFYSLGL